MDINEWDRIWKEIQIDTEGRLYTSANILDLEENSRQSLSAERLAIHG